MDQRPNLTFNDLIRLALLSQPEGQATLGQIYDFIEQSYPYYKEATECRFWKNSIRHNLCKSRQFRKIKEANLEESGKPYKRGSALWELCDIGLVVQGGSSKKFRPIRKKSSSNTRADNPARPSSVDSTGTNMSSLEIYNHPYPWQPYPVALTQSHPAIDVPSTGNYTAIPNSPIPATETFFKPWTTSPDHSLSSSHLEAPQLEELGSPSLGECGDPTPPQLTLLGQSHSINGGVLDPVGGAWSSSTTEALRAASPASILADTALTTSYPTSRSMPPNQHMYSDGLFWYSWYSL
ncbi:forkhead box protein O1-like [Patiria miniata]|uniref:Fork-head domain-containing protein n=1 Tax=Patiria miniata TaxID=46514 RepID=A0A913ZUH6_PATMI|nr:forkhead box protein O1-like [Patiria miniata]XP_038055359.1 forkhead box protein O1-like [Patiria miniata]